MNEPVNNTPVETKDDTPVSIGVAVAEENVGNTDESLPVAPDDKIADAEASSETESLPEPAYIKKERKNLIATLICVMFVTVSVIVYGVNIADKISRPRAPLSEMLLSEVLSGGVIKLGTTYTWPPLVRIPPQTVVDGEDPGASEHETVPEVELPPPSGVTLPMKAVDLSVRADDVFAIINETPYQPDTVSLYASDSTIPTVEELQATYGEDAPIVLIIHTHGTEAYSPHGATEYDSGESFRSDDPSSGVVAVGRTVRSVFESHGIGVIHLETMFDYDDYNMAYYNAAREIKRLTEEYPSISYVFDIHRDAMITSDGVNLKPTSPSVSTVDGVSAAQIMLVIGTDHAGSGHSEWTDNMALALKIQKSALGFDPGIMRPLNLRSASFNEQYTKGSLLVEVGAAGNSVEEACLAGTIFAEAAVRVMMGK